VHRRLELLDLGLEVGACHVRKPTRRDGLENSGRDKNTAEEIAARTVNKGAGGRTKAQLYNQAKDKGVKGRSTMSKAELEKAVGR